MQKFFYPSKTDWERLLQRPLMDLEKLYDVVSPVLEKIKSEGDSAVRYYAEKYDGYKGDNFKLSPDEIANAEKELSIDLKEAISTAAKNIELFHSSQKQEVKKITIQAGVSCWQKSVAIQKVGLYIPGGTAPLFSTVLMLAIPARIAGCKDIILCSPPDKDGNIHPAILFAAQLSGVDKIFKIGGIQAIGAMSYGSETVPKVYKLFGPGNKYVTAAKQLVSLKDTAIDMPAGPSEVLVMCDETANPAFIAADLLSQAEHGAGSQVILLSSNEDVLAASLKEIDLQLKDLPREVEIRNVLQDSRAILLNSIDEMIEFSDLYAPEHLILSVENAELVADRIINAGSVFIGSFTPESAGDYASGTNHTLPTYGYAKSYSGVNLDSFVRKITFQEITEQGLIDLGPVIEKMAEAELLEAHKNAVSIRLKYLKDIKR